MTQYVTRLLHVSVPSNVFIFEHNYSVKGGLKVIDCIVQSAEYWRLMVHMLSGWSTRGFSMSQQHAKIFVQHAKILCKC